MPPKRKAAGGAKAGGKKAKKAEPPAKPAMQKKNTLQRAVSAAKKAAVTDGASSKPKNIKPDKLIPGSASYSVVDDYDCMLNQTNIGQNNNKYYVIQLLTNGGRYWTWNRWGRVGENGANSFKCHGTNLDAAKKDFEKKFQDKTRHKWTDRANFKPSKGKYTLLEMSYDDDDASAQTSNNAVIEGSKKILPSKLDAPTQTLMKLIFSKDMFREAMADLNLDVKKMPLGKLSKAQIAKGFEVLEAIEEAIDKKQTAKLAELSSRFYTVIPHNFGRLVPPVIRDQDTLRSKMDMLIVLSDIVVAQELQKESEQKQGSKVVEEVPNPMDVDYESLKAELTTVKPTDKDYKLIENYIKSTGYGNLKLINAWRVDRSGEEDRHSKAGDAKLDNRKLLWHGTNVAVVAAILKSGLRIMPHSGGRLGSGIYFASENAKSAGYVRRAAGNIGIMFLNEVALGKVKKLHNNDCSLKKAPPGFDSVLGQGRQEPDGKADTVLEFNKRKVVVPQGKPVPVSEAQGSGFWNSEYLIYRESQCRIRYLLKIKF